MLDEAKPMPSTNIPTWTEVSLATPPVGTGHGKRPLSWTVKKGNSLGRPTIGYPSAP